MMQRSEANKHVAIALLVLLLLIIGPAYYFMYYRHRIIFLLSADLVRRLTETLLSDAPAMEKLKAAEAVAHEPLPAALQTLVEEIRTTLKTSAEVELVGKERIRLLEEQLGRSELEDERLHLSNSTLDNSLSTLKHETMNWRPTTATSTSCSACRPWGNWLSYRLRGAPSVWVRFCPRRRGWATGQVDRRHKGATSDW